MTTPVPSAHPPIASGTTPTASKLCKPTSVHSEALQNLREFLTEKTCYDILPESFRLIVFDNSLGIKRALTALMTNGVVSAPLYDSTRFKFCGMFTLTDVIHLIQYFYLRALPTHYSSEQPSTASSIDSSPIHRVHPTAEVHIPPPQKGLESDIITHSPAEDPYALAAAEVESFPLSRLRDIEQAIEAPPPPTVHVHPDAPLLEACEHLIRSHARRIPLIDVDATTGKDAILCVLTQYRVLKFIAINAQADVERLTQSIGTLGIGSYVSSYQSGKMERLSSDEDYDPFHPLATATLQTTVFDVVHMFSERGISAVPIVDPDGSVIDMYEAVDIVDLVRTDAYRLLDLTIAEAISRRSWDFAGVTVCSAQDSLSNILKYIGEKRVHRFVIVEGETTMEDVSSGTATVEGVGEGENETSTPLAQAGPPKFTSSDQKRAYNESGHILSQPDVSGVGVRTKVVKDRLVGMLCLSDIMKHIVGTKQKSLQGKTIVGLGVGEKNQDLKDDIVSKARRCKKAVATEDEMEEEDLSVVLESEDMDEDE